MRENSNQNNSEYEHFSRSALVVSQVEMGKDLIAHFTYVWFLKAGISAYNFQRPNQQIQFLFRV